MCVLALRHERKNELNEIMNLFMKRDRRRRKILKIVRFREEFGESEKALVNFCQLKVIGILLKGIIRTGVCRPLSKFR